MSFLLKEQNSKKALLVSPSLLAADYGYLADAAISAEKGGADLIHVDYMDGHYVPNISFGIDLIPALKKRVKLPLEAHLMISNPEERVEDFIRVKPDFIIFQEDTLLNHNKTISMVREAGIRPGLAINPGRDLSEIEDYLHLIDYLLILGVHPGFGGQKFIRDTLKKMVRASEIKRERNFNYLIAVDGGVNLKTAPEIVKTGVDILVAGSAIYGRKDVKRAISDFKSLIRT